MFVSYLSSVFTKMVGLNIFYCINIYKWFEHKFLQLTRFLPSITIYNCIVVYNGKYIEMDITNIVKLLNKRTCIKSSVEFGLGSKIEVTRICHNLL